MPPLSKYLNFNPTGLLLLAGVALAAPRLHAVPTLILYDGTTTKTIVDNGALDSNSAPGEVTYIGTIGVWASNVSTGFVLGSNNEPELALSSVNRSSRAGSLTIYFSANGFGPTLGGEVDVAFGGTLAKGASITLKTADNASNVLLNRTNFATLGTVLTTQSFSAPSAAKSFSGDTSALFSLTGPYSISEMVKLTHTGAGVSSFGVDAVFLTPDSGTTVTMLGGCLLLIAFVRRRATRA